MTTRERTLANPLTRAELDALAQGEKQIGEIESAITKAEQAGIDVADLKTQLQARKEAIRRLRSVYDRKS